MRAQAQTEGAPLIDHAESSLGEHVNDRGARGADARNHSVGYRMVRSSGQLPERSHAVRPMNHREQSLVRHGGNVDLRAGGDAEAASDGHVPQSRDERVLLPQLLG